MKTEIEAYLISGLFTIISILLSGWQIWTHLIYNPSRMIRKFIIRILLMVPIYALTSYFALVFNKKELLFETLRDCYEAFVLYSFYCFLVEYLGGKSILANTLRSKKQIYHSFPFCCIKTWKMGNIFLENSSFGILQYIPIKVFASIITLMTSLAGIYGEGEFLNPFVAYPYLCFMLSISQGWALYCLILFFLGTKDELAPVKPFPKFLAIKAIIFFTYWQSIIISLLKLFNVISEKNWQIGCPEDCWSANKIALALNNFIICIEMLLFSIAHHYAFSIQDFLAPSLYNSLSPTSNNVSSSLLSFNMRRRSTDMGLIDKTMVGTSTSLNNIKDNMTDNPINSNNNNKNYTPTGIGLSVNAPLLANFMDAINVTDVSTDIKNSRKTILTKKQALAAQYDRLSISSGNW